MAGCAAYTPLYWYFRQADDPGYRFGDDGMDYVGLAISTIGFASGLITTLRKSQAERRNLAYRALKKRLYPTVAPQLGLHSASVVIALRY